MTDEENVDLHVRMQTREREIDREYQLKEKELHMRDREAERSLQHRAEAVRIAQATLTENARSKPTSERNISAEDIKAYADVLAQYITNGT